MNNDKNHLICYCKQISYHLVIKAIQDGAKTLKEVQQATTACTGNECKNLNPKGVCCSVDILPLLAPKTKTCSCNC